MNLGNLSNRLHSSESATRKNPYRYALSYVQESTYTQNGIVLRRIITDVVCCSMFLPVYVMSGRLLKLNCKKGGKSEGSVDLQFSPFYSLVNGWLLEKAFSQ